MTITEFLEARIAEDEAAARKLPTVTDEPQWSAHYGKNIRYLYGTHDPGRVLAECAAKREIIPHLQDFTALEALAYVYKDHPDYDKNWRR